MQQSEYIPDGHDLYRRALPSQCSKTGKLTTAAFTLRPKEQPFRALSVDWSNYTTPEEASVDPNPKFGGRILFVGEIKARIPREQNLEVVHTPTKSNPAHSSIRGQGLVDSHSRLLIADILAENCRTLIRPIKHSNL